MSIETKGQSVTEFVVEEAEQFATVRRIVGGRFDVYYPYRKNHGAYSWIVVGKKRQGRGKRRSRTGGYETDWASPTVP